MEAVFKIPFFGSYLIWSTLYHLVQYRSSKSLLLTIFSRTLGFVGASQKDWEIEPSIHSFSIANTFRTLIIWNVCLIPNTTDEKCHYTDWSTRGISCRYNQGDATIFFHSWYLLSTNTCIYSKFECVENRVQDSDKIQLLTSIAKHVW